MPFEVLDKKMRWRAPTKEEIAENKASIVEVEGGGVTGELTKELRDQVEAAVANMIPGAGWGIISSSNENLYSTIQNVTAVSQGLVDVILPVYNSFHIVKDCVKALMDRTKWPFHLTIVDDCSDEKTKLDLEALEKQYDNVTLIRNDRNRGFAASVNRGIKASKGEYVCLLNSDVLVTPLWLTKLIMALKSDKRNQIVCPATNNTAIVNVPLSEGASYLAMNTVLEKFALRRYPEIIPTGFCFMFPRDLTSKIGYFDEAFKNFGEESDFWMKALSFVEGQDYLRYKAVMADDTYVFHERGASYASLGDETHMHLRKLASGRFNNLWPQFPQWQRTYNPQRALGHLREKIPYSILNQNKASYKICWVVHSATMCGGMKYISDVINEINERGGDARVAMIKRAENSNKEALGELRTAPIIFDSYEDFVTNFPAKAFSDGVVVASTAELVGTVKELCDSQPKLDPILHIQSYEPALVPDPELANAIKPAFKMFANCISNSNWISNILEKDLGVTPLATVLPGVDTDLFYPRNRESGDERPTIMIPLIKSYEFKGYNRGLELIKELEKQEDMDLRILVYGVQNLPMISKAICLGQVSQVRLAQLLGTEVDAFIDPSHVHSYGMPALEALASGCRVVSWDNKGVNEYAKAGVVEIYPDDTSVKDVAAGILGMLSWSKSGTVSNPVNFARIKEEHNRETSVSTFIEAIEKHLSLIQKSRRIVVVTPHLRKHGGPTTLLGIANKLAERGHEVSVTTVYSDINPEVLTGTELPVSLDPHAIPKCDVLITNSDNPMNEVFAKLSQAKKKIMIKLSHNERFKSLEEGGLKQNWDAIWTTTDWLKDVCENPIEGWDHPASKATRIGWWNYSFDTFQKKDKEYGDGKTRPIVIGTLVHRHPLKGTKDAIQILGAIAKKYSGAVKFIGIGEVAPSQFNSGLPFFKYQYAPNRAQMAELMGEMDIWLSASHTEGLGRMALEAMSAKAACVLTDTGAEFAKDNQNCLVYPIGDRMAGAACVDALIKDRAGAACIAENGYKTAETYADSSACVKAIEKSIEEVFNG